MPRGIRKKQSADPAKRAEVIAQARSLQAQRDTGYRERALKLFPHVCGRCGREFAGKSLNELTVHHKDHNHDNNPPDGSNWELLCVYCHDDEHQDAPQRDGYHADPLRRDPDTSLGHNAFEGLKDLLPDKDPSTD